MSLQIGSHWQGANSAFMQQGQVDWVAFGNTIWTASSAVLQRFAAAGIQPVTYGAGLVLFNQMHLDRVGQSRMEKAVASLKTSSSWGKLLWFGFGYQTIVHTMAESLAGIKCLAICACLAESHSEELAAWVLSELWRTSNFPEEYEPSHSQFLALIKSSAGVITGTDFSMDLNTMLGDQLWREPSGSHYTEFLVREMEDGVLEASHAKDIANALHGLFKISRGDADHMVVTGGSECAFISTVAHWLLLLNLRVLVRNSDGRVIFDDVRKETSRQVVVQYGKATNEPLQVAGTTYVLGNCREVFGRIPEPDEYHLLVRTPWSGCLSRVFGTGFKSLANMPYVLGDYLGGVARIYRAVATGENNIGNLSRFHYVNYSETSYGLGFVNTVISTFPELNSVDGLLDRMQHNVNITFDEAIRNVEQSILSLEAICTCEYCASGQEENTLWPDNSRDFGISELHPAVKGIYEFSALGKQPESPIHKAAETMADYHEGTKTVHINRTWTRPDFYWNALGLRHQHGTLMAFDHHPLESVCLLLQGSITKSEETSIAKRTGSAKFMSSLARYIAKIVGTILCRTGTS
ncbi:highly reducing polyketide synthase alt5 [Physcia stellaris]|nr:highly reducing polyketide synthase alt5 [Physcia stellaris]